MGKLKVILDTDIDNESDDLFALSYLLKNQDIFNIEAITIAPFSHVKYNVSVMEGQEKSYKEAIKICGWLNFKTEHNLFKGATDFIKNGYNQRNDAVNKIIEVALKNEKTYILSTGAITNVALAIKFEPRIIDKIEVVWLGGHSLLQENNLEYNFRQDVDAVRIVFNSLVKFTIIPCKNVASNLRTSIFELKHYLQGKSKLCDYLIERFYNDGYHGFQYRRIIWDIAVVAYLINKNWFSEKIMDCPKINDDTSYKIIKNKRKITMVNDIKVDEVFNDLFDKLRNN